MLFWVPTVAPDIYMRYVVSVVPAGCLLAAWLLVRGSGSYAPRLAWPGAVVLALTPWLAVPMHAVISAPPWSGGRVLRSELSRMGSEIFGNRPDPNRLVVDWLQQNAAPQDEILINYEDVPLMFYLPNPIRGGIAAFRAEDDSRTAPRFAVMRDSVPFVHWPVFERELSRYDWEPVPLKAPDVIWGNNPDPTAHFMNPSPPTDLFIARRTDN
jgi:hypothetical protein